MKIIKPEDLPIEMNSENIDILAHMMMSMPPSKEWRLISNLITYDERCLIRKRIKKIKEEQEQERWNSLTPEEQAEEKRKIEESMKDKTTFRGNLLEQERHAADLEMKWLKERETEAKNKKREGN